MFCCSDLEKVVPTSGEHAATEAVSLINHRKMSAQQGNGVRAYDASICEAMKKWRSSAAASATAHPRYAGPARDRDEPEEPPRPHSLLGGTTLSEFAMKMAIEKQAARSQIDNTRLSEAPKEIGAQVKSVQPDRQRQPANCTL